MLTKACPKVSVIVATHNREATLASCLNSLKNQLFPKNKYEVIVVDNSSADNTKGIVSLFLKKSKLFKYIYEPKLGLSIARNTGIIKAKSKIIAFIDDDARADKNWLKNLIEPFSENIWAVGGEVNPIFEIKPPKWLPKKHKYAITIVNLGKKIKKVPYIVGTNMAFKKEVFKKIGFFDPKIGQLGRSVVPGDEMDLCERITKAKGTILYTPYAIVNHLVSKERLTKLYFTKRVFAEGTLSTQLDQKRVHLTRRLRLLVYHRPKAALMASFNLLGSLIKNNDEQSMSNWCDLLWNVGYIYGTLFPRVK